MRKHALLALSLSNLMFIPAWRSMFLPVKVFYYYDHPPGWKAFIGLLLDVLLVALVFFLLARAKARFPSLWVQRTAKTSFVLLTCCGLMNFSQDVRSAWVWVTDKIPSSFWLFDLSESVFVLGIVAVLVVLLLVGIRYQTAISDAVKWVVLSGAVVQMAVVVLVVLSPLVVVLAGNAAWETSQVVSRPEFAPQPPLEPAPESGRRALNRVVWIIFDEWDQEFTFDSGPDVAQVPELNRLRSESIYATHAKSLWGETLFAIPSLLTGIDFFEVYPDSPTALTAKRRSDMRHPVIVNDLPTVFSEAKAMGLQVGVGGWYHPYNRLFENDLTQCYGVPAFLFSAYYPDEDTVFGWMLLDLRVACGTIPYLHERVPFSSRRALLRHAALRDYTKLSAAARRLAVDPNLDLVFLHLPIPHPPGIYNSAEGELSESLDASYLDNLALTDRTWGTLRRDLEQAGLWERTTVLLSADHPARLGSWNLLPMWLSDTDKALVANAKVDEWRHVPFLLKLAGDSQPVPYDEEFATILSKDLVVAILAGEIHTNAEAAAWIDRRREQSLSPSGVTKDPGAGAAP